MSKKVVKSKLYVAVICSEIPPNVITACFYSGRSSGDWSCTLSRTKDGAVAQAMKLRDKWTASGNYGPYEIYVGELTGRVRELLKYSEVPLV